MSAVVTNKTANSLHALRAIEKAAREYFTITHGVLKDDAVCDHGVGICWCDYNRAAEELRAALDLK